MLTSLKIKRETFVSFVFLKKISRNNFLKIIYNLYVNFYILYEKSEIHFSITLAFQDYQIIFKINLFIILNLQNLVKKKKLYLHILFVTPILQY